MLSMVYTAPCRKDWFNRLQSPRAMASVGGFSFAALRCRQNVVGKNATDVGARGRAVLFSSLCQGGLHADGNLYVERHGLFC